MKKLFSLLLAVILLLSFSTAHASQRKYQLHLDIEYDQNILMARYDVDVVINGIKMAQLTHGGHLRSTFAVPEGLCSITFAKVGEPAVCVTTIVGIIQDTQVTGEIHANLADLEFRSLTTNCPENAYRFTEGDILNLDGTHLCITGHRTASSYNDHRPAPGKTFLVCQAEFTNTTSANIAIVAYLSSMLFDACCDDYEIDCHWGAMYNLDSGITAENILSLLGGLRSGSEVIHPQKMAVIELVYEVPVNWNTLEIFYTDSTLAAGEAVIVIRNR